MMLATPSNMGCLIIINRVQGCLLFLFIWLLSFALLIAVNQLSINGQQMVRWWYIVANTGSGWLVGCCHAILLPRVKRINTWRTTTIDRKNNRNKLFFASMVVQPMIKVVNQWCTSHNTTVYSSLQSPHHNFCASRHFGQNSRSLWKPGTDKAGGWFSPRNVHLSSGHLSGNHSSGGTSTYGFSNNNDFTQMSSHQSLYKNIHKMFASEMLFIWAPEQ